MLANKTTIKFKMQRKSVAILIPLLFLFFVACNSGDNAPKTVETSVVEQQLDGVSITGYVPDPSVLEQQTEPEIEKAEPVPVAVVEIKPQFQGGDENEFTKWVAKNLTYPKEAKDKGIQGRVILSFVVDEKGKVTDVKVLRGVDPLLDETAVNAISVSPDWVPGKQKGKPVAVKYTFPIIFQLR